MKQSILISGVGGSGKTTLAHELKARGYETYDMEEAPDLFQMIHKTTGDVVVDLDTFDNNDVENIKQYDWNINRNELKRLIAKQQDDVAFYCGIASNQDDVLNLFTKVIILVANPDTIITRLKSRKDNEHGHTEDVRAWVLSWKDWWEDHALEKGGIAVEADADANTVADRLIAEVTPP